MEPHEKLTDFLKPYATEVREIFWELRNFITSTIPEANELIWDNYNAVAIAYSKSEKLSDAFCHIAIYAKHVNFGFNRGAELTNTSIQLEGKGKLIRHLKVRDIHSFPKESLEKMIYEAVGISENRNQNLIEKHSEGISKVMSISEKKTRPKVSQ